VVFAHDTELALQAAVTLVNSAEDPDTLTSVAELDRVWDDFGYTGGPSPAARAPHRRPRRRGRHGQRDA
jgi:hypothetical protein